LDYEPDEPPVPQRQPGQRDRQPAEIQAMNLLGPLAKILSILTGGKQPEDQLHPRGVLGIELAEVEPEADAAGGAGRLRVAGVLADSPAARAGVQPGDILVRVLDRAVPSIKAARQAVAAVRPDDRVAVVVRRGAQAEELTLSVIAGE